MKTTKHNTPNSYKMWKYQPMKIINLVSTEKGFPHSKLLIQV